MDSAAVDTRPLEPADLSDLATLFGTSRNTRHCWCMALCSSPAQFAAGWFGGGNRRRFEARAVGSGPPMGILACVAGEPVGWCACGPRRRYATAVDSANSVLRDRMRTEDDAVWLLPCLFVRPDHRGQGIPYALVRAAVEQARRDGAAAVEGWPSADSDRQPSDAFLGRQQVFEELGFECVAQPTQQRVIMRLELAGG